MALIDREKVIKAFEICDNNEDGIVCKNCPYKEDKWNGAWEDETGKTCFQTLHADVLALLKDQQNVISGLKVINDGLCEAVTEQKQIVRCKDCKHSKPYSTGDGKFLYGCKFGNRLGEGDWFCADGERRNE